MARIYLDADVDRQYVLPLSAAGHDVLTSRQVGRSRAHDDEQLSFSATQNRIFISHNGDDYKLLQRAWRSWADDWDVIPRPRHAGILILPQQSPFTVEQISHEVDAFISSGIRLANRCYEFSAATGWVQEG